MQQVNEQLVRLLLYGDAALSPDGAHIAWVNRPPASTSKQTYVRARRKRIRGTHDIPIGSERTDFDPACLPIQNARSFFKPLPRKNSGSSGS